MAYLLLVILSQVHLKWADPALEFLYEDLYLGTTTKFVIEKVHSDIRNLNQKIGTGNNSAAVTIIEFQRNVGYYVYQVMYALQHFNLHDNTT